MVLHDTEACLLIVGLELIGIGSPVAPDDIVNMYVLPRDCYS